MNGGYRKGETRTGDRMEIGGRGEERKENGKFGGFGRMGENGEKRKEGRHGGHKEWTVSDLIHCRGFCFRGMFGGR